MPVTSTDSGPGDSGVPDDVANGSDAADHRRVALLFGVLAVVTVIVAGVLIVVAGQGEPLPDGAEETLGAPIASVPELPSGPQRYVALGDSRAAGPTTGLLAPAPEALGADGCVRGEAGYPPRVAARLQIEDFVDVSCSGARSENLGTTGQLTPRVGGAWLPVPLQFDALTPATTLVTLSIGGNDIDWFSIIAPCFTWALGDDANCRSNPDIARYRDEQLTALRGLLDADLAAIARRAPRATVFVIGHGGYFAREGCDPDALYSPADGDFIIDFFARFNQVFHDAAAAHRMNYLDVATPSIGHDACSAPEERWYSGNVENVIDGITMPVRHPTRNGGEALGRIVTDEIANRLNR